MNQRSRFWTFLIPLLLATVLAGSWGVIHAAIAANVSGALTNRPDTPTQSDALTPLTGVQSRWQQVAPTPAP